MELTFRTATPAERLYSASQSMQLKGQTGCVGHLRAGTGTDAQGFLKTWQSHRQDLDTEEFQAEFESVLNALVGNGQYGGFLKSRDAMKDFCQQHPESSFDDGFAFGFRADTAQYSYLIRLNPYLPMDIQGANLFFQLIARRYEKTSTVFTSNKTFSQWNEVFADVTIASAILDRVLHHCTVINIKGESYRLKERKEFIRQKQQIVNTLFEQGST